jgi:PTS system galactitol-specific IIA component
VKTKFQIDKRVVKIGLQGGDKAEVLKRMAEMLKKAGYVKESYITGILKREDIFPTGLPTGEYGVAIPHTDVEHVNSPMIAVATLKKAVEFNVMGGDEGDKIDVKIIFMLAMKDGNAQLTLLQSLMGVIQDSKLLKGIYEAKEVDSLVSMLNVKLCGHITI